MNDNLNLFYCTKGVSNKRTSSLYYAYYVRELKAKVRKGKGEHTEINFNQQRIQKIATIRISKNKECFSYFCCGTSCLMY